MTQVLKGKCKTCGADLRLSLGRVKQKYEFGPSVIPGVFEVLPLAPTDTAAFQCDCDIVSMEDWKVDWVDWEEALDQDKKEEGV